MVSNPIRENQNKLELPKNSFLMCFKPYKGKSKYSSTRSIPISIPIVSNPIRENQNAWIMIPGGKSDRFQTL